VFNGLSVALERAKKALGVAAGIAGAVRAGLRGRKATIYLDVGSRGGLPARWRPVASAGLIVPVYVEPDLTEAAQLAARFPKARLIRSALGSMDNAVAMLRLTREPGRSSLLEPNPDVIAAFADTQPWDVLDRQPLTVRRLDCIWGDNPAPEFLKVDVQGYELEVLKGMGALLDEVICLEAEVSLCRFYEQQATFEEVREFLFAKGFDLVRIAALGLYRGQAMVEFNTFWVRRNFHDDPRTRLWKKVNDIGNPRRVNVWGY
jgi:FkbM family methyltransferase